MSTESLEIVKKPYAELAEPALTPDDFRRALEVRATLAAQDDALVLQALREGWLSGCGESIRVARTPDADPEEGGPVYVSVGSSESPDGVMAGMVGRTFTVRHVRVASPSWGGQPALLSGARVALPSPHDSPSKDTNGEENHEQ